MPEDLHTMLAAGATVVTPTRRLARHIAGRFDRAQADTGRQAWPSADVLPWGAWIERMLDEVLGGPGPARQMLSAAQERELWRRTIRASDPHGDTLWLAGQAQEAWRLQREWRIRLAHPGPQWSDDVRVYAGWARAFSARCRSRAWITAADAVDVLLGGPIVADDQPPGMDHDGVSDTWIVAGIRAAAPGGVLVLYAFDALTAQQRALVEACARAGVAVRNLAPSAPAGTACSWLHAQPQDEFAAIASQARALLARDPGARIGIVVPDLAAQRAMLVRALDDVFDPARMHGAADGRLPYALSLGLPLAQWAPVRPLLLILRFAFDALTLASVGELLLSPFLSQAESELHERALLDVALRKRGGLTLSAEDFVRQAQEFRFATGRCQGLSASLARWHAQVRALRGRRLPSQWADAFLKLLTALGWPGERSLDSAEYQAVARAHEMVRNLATFDVVSGHVEGREALAQVAGLLSDTVFQPEAPEAPVQVLGVLESAGLNFDHLFVTGMTDQAWPAPARPNPLLPLMIQRSANVPHAHLDWERAFARRMMDLWSATATHVVYSCPLRRDDVTLRPSALVSALPGFRPKIEPGGISRVRQLFESRRVECMEDRRAPAVSVGQHVRGGAGVLKDQSACPFRAFAVHRLSARKLEEGRVGLDARDRGILVHAVMAAYSRRVTSLEQLQSLDEHALRAHVDAAVAEGLAGMATTRAHLMPPLFRLNEAARLSRLLLAFVQLEHRRMPFRVRSRESGGEISIGGLVLGARPDRIDEIEHACPDAPELPPDPLPQPDASARGACLAIIDYKTGEVSIKDWFGHRPRDPQLPLYALAHASDVALVAFARLSVRGVEWRGIARIAGFIEGVGWPDANPAGEAGIDHWDALLAYWGERIAALADGYRSGQAEVDPRDGRKTCEHCGLETLCRIRHGSDTVEDAAEGESEDEGKGEGDGEGGGRQGNDASARAGDGVDGDA